MVSRLMRLDDWADAWFRRHQSWRFAVKVFAVETVLSAVLVASLGGLKFWWIGPLAWFGNAPVFVLFLPVRRGGWLSRLDDRVLGPPRPSSPNRHFLA